MHWIDTHAHLFHESFHKDLPEVLARSHQAGLEAIYLPNLNVDSLAAMYALESEKRPRCYACIGLHPCYITESWEEALHMLEKELTQRNFAAIGETGLDAYHNPDTLPAQEKAFLRHCYWAKQYKLPLLLHGRGTTKRLLTLLQQERPPQGGVLHCFSGTYTEAVTAIDLGFFIGVGGVLTYKGGHTLRDLVKRVPLEALVLETDAPYLAPAGIKGRRNEPAFLPLIGKVLAKRLGLPLAEIATQTTQNAQKLFQTKR